MASHGSPREQKALNWVISSALGEKGRFGTAAGPELMDSSVLYCVDFQ